MININSGLDELPDEIFVPLGSRGFQPIKLKKCNYCETENRAKMKLLEKRIKKDGNIEVSDYKIKCGNCDQIFTIRCQSYYEIRNNKRERVLSRVHILDAAEVDLGWLGCF